MSVIVNCRSATYNAPEINYIPTIQFETFETLKSVSVMF